MRVHRDFYRLVEEICGKDSRYKPDAYEFLMHALHFTQDSLKRRGHIQGAELLEGIRKLIIEQYGPMAKTVLSHWGVTTTEDFGNIVFNMVGHGILSKRDEDRLADFKDVYDFADVFGDIFRDTPLTIE